MSYATLVVNRKSCKDFHILAPNPSIHAIYKFKYMLLFIFMLNNRKCFCMRERKKIIFHSTKEKKTSLNKFFFCCHKNLFVPFTSIRLYLDYKKTVICSLFLVKYFMLPFIYFLVFFFY